MGAKKSSDGGEQDLFQSRLDQLINMNHLLAHLCRLMKGERLHEHFTPYYAEKSRAALPVRLLVGRIPRRLQTGH